MSNVMIGGQQVNQSTENSALILETPEHVLNDSMF